MSNQPISILYDISVLGLGHYNEKARTGVARVIENLAIELIRSDSVDLSFSANQSIIQFIQARKYLESLAWAEGISLHPAKSLLLRALANQLVKIFPEPGNGQYLKLLNSSLRAIGKMFDDFKIDTGSRVDLYHSTYYPVSSFPQLSKPCRKVVTVYDLIPILFSDYFSSPETALITKVVEGAVSADSVTVISESTKSDICNFTSIDPTRVFVTLIAASDFFRPCENIERIMKIRERYEIPEGPYILSLCTLEPRKNIEQTIRSYVQLVRQQGIHDLNLVLVGTKGWDFDRIFVEIKGAKGLQGRIVATGYVPDEALSPLYSGAMMFVYPSLYEGFGLPPLEAMQCGVPVITSNTSALPEVIGDAGIMLDPRDGAALSEAMLDLYRDSAQRSVLSKLGVARAANFSWRKCAEQTETAYQAAIDRNV